MFICTVHVNLINVDLYRFGAVAEFGASDCVYFDQVQNEKESGPSIRP